MASGRRTAGAGEPAVRWASAAPTAETRDREAPPFKDKIKTRHVNKGDMLTEKRGLLCEEGSPVSHDAMLLCDALLGLGQWPRLH